MSKWMMIIFFTFITGNFLFAQQNNLEIKGTGNNIFVEHTVLPKESFYSIGRMFNVNPKELASFNHLKLQSGLGIGDILKIPLNKNNFVQTGKATNTEALIPVYHTVESGETLYRLGVNYNKVPLASLKKWNHLQSDAVTVGTPMIVGYLKVNKSQSSLADGKTNVSNEVAVTSPTEEKPAEKATETIAHPAPTEQEPEDVKTDKPQATVSQPEPATTVTNSETTKISGSLSGGYFKNLYNQQTTEKPAVSKTGSAGVFKSTSGWQDGKYYCFNNEAAPGTVIKVTDNATGKSVYAKVLDAIPDIKQNSGLAVIISNAAAQELGVGENKFDCSFSYAK